MLESPLRIVGRFPRPVRLLLVGTLVNKLGTFIVPYLTLVLLRDLHMREGEAARLLFAYGAARSSRSSPAASITDRFGRRRTLLVSLFGSGVLAVAMGLAPSARFFVPLLVAFGFIADLYRPAASAIIGDLLPSSERASGFAGLRMAVNLGWASGTAIGGLLADWDWRLLFLGDGLTTLAYGVARLLHDPRDAPGARGVVRSPGAGPTAAAAGSVAARPSAGGRRTRCGTASSSRRRPRASSSRSSSAATSPSSPSRSPSPPATRPSSSASSPRSTACSSRSSRSRSRCA